MRHILFSVTLVMFVVFAGCTAMSNTDSISSEPAPNLTISKDSSGVLPNAEARRASGGSDAVQLRPGLTLVEGHSYTYQTQYKGRNGTLQVDVDDLKPNKFAIIRPNYTVGTSSNTSNLFGSGIEGLRADLSNTSVDRLLFHTILTFPYGNATTITADTSAGTTHTVQLANGSTATLTVTEWTTMSVPTTHLSRSRDAPPERNVTCAIVEITRGDELLATAAYAPGPQVLVRATYYQNGIVSRHIHLTQAGL